MNPKQKNQTLGSEEIKECKSLKIYKSPKLTFLGNITDKTKTSTSGGGTDTNDYS